MKIRRRERFRAQFDNEGGASSIGLILLTADACAKLMVGVHAQL
jgi:hypothetical protein